MCSRFVNLQVVQFSKWVFENDFKQSQWRTLHLLTVAPQLPKRQSNFIIIKSSGGGGYGNFQHHSGARSPSPPKGDDYVEMDEDDDIADEDGSGANPNGTQASSLATQDSEQIINHV